jgi:FkbM family methyltransferase
MEPHQMAGRVFDLRHKRLIQMDGFEMYVMPNDCIGSVIVKYRNWEPDVTCVVRNKLRSGDVFLDLGANVGYFSLLASSLVGPAGRVIAFEPNPQNQQLIYESKLLNNCANLTVYPYAVSNRSEILRFTTVGSNGGVVTDRIAGQRYDLLVQSVVLDEFLPQHTRINFVKMDIEGHEPAALRGMEGLLRRHRPKLITEYHPLVMRANNVEPPEEFLKQLHGWGYRICVILPNGELAAMPSSEHVMNYWAAQKCETTHLDLYAEPIDG